MTTNVSTSPYATRQAELRQLILGEAPGWARPAIEERAKLLRRDVGESVADEALLERCTGRFLRWWSEPTGPAAAWLADSGRGPEAVYAAALRISDKYGPLLPNAAVALALEELIFDHVLNGVEREAMGAAHPMHPRH